MWNAMTTMWVHCGPDHQERFGVKCVAQGHFDIMTGGGEDWTANLVITQWAAVEPALT